MFWTGLIIGITVTPILLFTYALCVASGNGCKTEEYINKNK